MNPETRAARDRLAAFLDARTPFDSPVVAGAAGVGKSKHHLTEDDLRLVLAALDQQPTADPWEREHDCNRDHPQADIMCLPTTYTRGIDPGMSILGPSRAERAREHIAERKCREQQQTSDDSSPEGTP